MKRRLHPLCQRVGLLVHPSASPPSPICPSHWPPSLAVLSLGTSTLHSPSILSSVPRLARLSSSCPPSSPSPAPSHLPPPSPPFFSSPHSPHLPHLPRDRILLHGLLFHAHHGVYPEERALGQKFEVDLSLSVSLTSAALSGDLQQSIDYGEVYRDVKREVEGTQCRLLEEVAWHVVGVVMSGYGRRVEEVVVRVKKPHVTVEGKVDFLGVELTRSRKEWEEERSRTQPRKRPKDTNQVTLE